MPPHPDPVAHAPTPSRSGSSLGQFVARVTGPLGTWWRGCVIPSIEQRLTAIEPQWQMQLAPPPLALPDIAFDGDTPTTEGAANLALAIWAARRTGLAVIVSGKSSASDFVLTNMREAGIFVQSNSSAVSGESVSLAWGL